MTSDDSSTRKLNSGTFLQKPQMLHTALVVAAVVLCFAMLSFYGSLVQSQVKRGETFREAQRAGLNGVSEGRLERPARAPGANNVPLLASVSPR